MSVVPFILNGNNKTVVETREEYEGEGGLEGTVIFIQNFDRDQIIGTRSSNATYDLRVGNEYQGHRDANKTNLENGDKIRLDPGSAVIIETMESVQLPKSRFGHIVPKVTLLQDGISNTSSKVDPGYNGHLLITVFNLGKTTIHLEKGQKFCTFYVLELNEGVIAYQKDGKKLPGNSNKRFGAKAIDVLERRATLFNLMFTLITTVLTCVTIVNTLSQNKIQQQQKIQLAPSNGSQSVQ